MMIVDRLERELLFLIEILIVFFREVAVDVNAAVLNLMLSIFLDVRHRCYMSEATIVPCHQCL